MIRDSKPLKRIALELESNMKFFVDSADLDQIAELNDIGLVDGVTTNPSIIAKSGRDFKEVIAEICKITDGHVSAEVVATDADKMLSLIHI